MTHAVANMLLDMIRDGYDIPLSIINCALELTGDIEHIACGLDEA